MQGLDTLDRKILFELDNDSRQSYSQLAKKLRQSRDRIIYRVERLLERGVISRFTASVNLYKLGFQIYKTYFRLENEKSKSAELLNYLKDHPRVYWLAQSDGSWDLMAAIFARNAKEYHSIHLEILTRFNSIILNSSMYTLVDVWKYPKNYLVGKGSESAAVGGVQEENKIDELDCGILNLICADSRIPMTDIADKLKTTPAIVKYRLQKLEEAEIITGYPIELDLKKLDMLFFKAQIYHREYNKALHQQLIDYCAKNPNITYCVSQLGECTVEIELEVLNYEQFNEIIDELRSKFSRLVRNFNTSLIRKFYFKWVPDDLQTALSI